MNNQPSLEVMYGLTHTDTCMNTIKNYIQSNIRNICQSKGKKNKTRTNICETTNITFKTEIQILIEIPKYSQDGRSSFHL